MGALGRAIGKEELGIAQMGLRLCSSIGEDLEEQLRSEFGSANFHIGLEKIVEITGYGGQQSKI